MSKDERLAADCGAAYRLAARAEGMAAELSSLLGRLVDGIERLTVERDEARAEVERMRVIRDTAHAKVEELRSENAKLWSARSEESVKNGRLQTELIDARRLLEVRSENIVRLERERDEARAEADRMRAIHSAGHDEDCGGTDGFRCGCGWMQGEGAHQYIQKIEAENERLREALLGVRKLVRDWDGFNDTRDEIEGAVRAALAGEVAR